MSWNNWLLIFLGVWLIASPWALGFYSINLMTWNNVVAGIFVILFALWNVSSPEE